VADWLTSRVRTITAEEQRRAAEAKSHAEEQAREGRARAEAQTQRVRTTVENRRRAVTSLVERFRLESLMHDVHRHVWRSKGWFKGDQQLTDDIWETAWKSFAVIRFDESRASEKREGHYYEAYGGGSDGSGSHSQWSQPHTYRAVTRTSAILVAGAFWDSGQDAAVLYCGLKGGTCTFSATSREKGMTVTGYGEFVGRPSSRGSGPWKIDDRDAPPVKQGEFDISPRAVRKLDPADAARAMDEVQQRLAELSLQSKP
jgi:hypothetical protein